MGWDVHHVYDQFPNNFEHAVTDDCIDNYIFLSDRYHDALNSNIQISCDHYPENITVTLDDQEFLPEEKEGYLS